MEKLEQKYQSLRKALATFGETLEHIKRVEAERYSYCLDRDSEGQYLAECRIYRDSAIHRFEYTTERLVP